MSSKGRTIIITPQTTQSPLPTCNPNLMPFHIGHTGPAAVSMFLRVEKIKTEEEVKEKKAVVVKDDGEGKEKEVAVKEVKEVDEANLDSVPPTNESTTKDKYNNSNTDSNVKDEDIEMKSAPAANFEDSQTTDVEMTADLPILTSPSPIPVSISSSPSKTLSGSIQNSVSTSTLVSSECLNSPTLASSSSSSLPTPISSSALKDIDKRFISSFRGRTIHGLTVDLPTGYTGLLLQGDPQSTATYADPATRLLNAEVKSGLEESEYQEISRGNKGGRRTRKGVVGNGFNGNGKGKAKEEQKETEKTAPRGRLARTAAPKRVVEPEVITVDDEDQEMADRPLQYLEPTKEDPNDPDDSVDEGIPLRKLIPQSTFSSITLWHADRAVDETRDEYYRTLTEWMALSHEIHRTDL